MAWQHDLARKLDRDSLVWLLAMAGEHSAGIGRNKTSNLKVYEGKIRAFAKNNGISDFDVLAGYKNLSSKTYEVPGLGKETLNNDDKSNDLLRWTTLGQAFIAHLRANPGWREELLRGLGASTVAPAEWWPKSRSGKEPVRMATTTLPPAAYPARLRVTAVLTCHRCGKEIRHEYDMTWQTDEFTKVAGRCPCGEPWRHYMGHGWPVYEDDS